MRRRQAAWIDRFVIYDDGSTDGSVEVLQAHPKVELQRLQRTDADLFVLSHTHTIAAWRPTSRPRPMRGSTPANCPTWPRCCVGFTPKATAVPEVSAGTNERPKSVA